MSRLYRRLTAASAAALLIFTAAWTRVEREQQQEEAAVRAALQHYLLGHSTGSGDHFKAAFYDGATMYWARNGQLMQRPIPEYIAGAPGKPAADEAQRKRRIVSVDVTGNAAMAKIELDYPQTKLTDYMSLLKINNEWRIVNKIYTSEPKTR